MNLCTASENNNTIKEHDSEQKAYSGEQLVVEYYSTYGALELKQQ